MQLLHPKRFGVTELPEAKAFLKREGYVVIGRVYTTEECDRFCEKLKNPARDTSSPRKAISFELGL